MGDDPIRAPRDKARIMNDLLSLIGHFNLEVLVCLIILVSIALGTVVLSVYRFIHATMERTKEHARSDNEKARAERTRIEVSV